MIIEELMQDIATALPGKSRQDRATVREVCLTFDQDSGAWRVIAGGHPSVHIGEWGGDFEGEGETAETALKACMDNIQRAAR